MAEVDKQAAALAWSELLEEPRLLLQAHSRLRDMLLSGGAATDSGSGASGYLISSRYSSLGLNDYHPDRNEQLPCRDELGTEA